MPKHKANSGSPCILRCRGPVHHIVAVVFAAIKVYLVQLHCDVSVGVKHPRMYASGVDKKTREDASTVHCRGPELTRHHHSGPRRRNQQWRASTTWTGSRPDARQPDGSRSLPAIGTLPSELRSAILHHGPRRPKVLFAISSENGNRRMFSETHYHAYYGAMEIERQWFCFSPMMTNPSR